MRPGLLGNSHEEVFPSEVSQVCLTNQPEMAGSPGIEIGLPTCHSNSTQVID